MYNIGQYVICSTFGGRIIMRVQGTNTEYTVELPCGLVFRVVESDIIKTK